METRNSHSLESSLDDFVGGSIGTIPKIEAEGDEECASEDGSPVEIELCATSEEMNISYQWYYFTRIGEVAQWWSSTEGDRNEDGSVIWYKGTALFQYSGRLGSHYTVGYFGNSVRCIRNY